MSTVEILADAVGASKSGAIVVAALVVVLLGACASPPPPNSSVRPATPDQVAGCRYIDDVVSTPRWYEVFVAKGVEAARQDVLDKAATAGATHIVWMPATAIYGGSSAAAKAYRCPA